MGNNKHASKSATQAIVTRVLLLLPNFDERKAEKFYWKWRKRIKKTIKNIRNTIASKIPAQPSVITLMRQPCFVYSEASLTATNWRKSCRSISSVVQARPGKRRRLIDEPDSDSTLHCAPSGRCFQRAQTQSCVGSRQATNFTSYVEEPACPQESTGNNRYNFKMPPDQEDPGQRYPTEGLGITSSPRERENGNQVLTINGGWNPTVEVVENQSDTTQTSTSSVSLQLKASPSDILVHSSRSAISKQRLHDRFTDNAATATITSEATTNTNGFPNAKYFWVTRPSDAPKNTVQQCETYSIPATKRNRIWDSNNGMYKTGFNASTSTNTDFFFKHVLQMRPTFHSIRNHPCCKYSVECPRRRREMDSEEIIRDSNNPSVTSRANYPSSTYQSPNTRDQYDDDRSSQIRNQDHYDLQSDSEVPAMHRSRPHTQHRSSHFKQQSDPLVTEDYLNQPNYHTNYLPSSAHLNPGKHHVKVLHIKAPKQEYSKIGRKSKKIIVTKRRSRK